MTENFEYNGVVSLAQVQLELDFTSPDSDVTEYIVEHPRKILKDCQKYYETGYEENQIIGDGSQQCYGLTDNVAFKETKVKTPKICIYNAVTGGMNPPKNIGIIHKSTRKFVASSNIENIDGAYGLYDSSVQFNWSADSELPVAGNNPTYITSTRTTTTKRPSND